MKHESTLVRKPYVRFSKLTDGNWNNGIERNGNIILIDKPSIADRTLVGKTLEYNKKTYKVTDVRYQKGFTHVILDNKVYNVDASSNIAFIKKTVRQ